MTKAKTDSKPHKDFVQITQVGLKAYNVALLYPTQLAGRLDASLLTTLASDLASLGTVVPAAKTAQGAAIASTATQSTELETGAQMVSGARMAVARNSADAGVRKGYGVGRRMNKLLVKDVKQGLQLIVDRATANAQEAAGFGILAADVTRYKAQITAIDTADQAQEKARAGLPQSTRQRNTVARRILSAVAAIAGAGAVAFDTSPTERATFEALVKKVK